MFNPEAAGKAVRKIIYFLAALVVILLIILVGVIIHYS